MARQALTDNLWEQLQVTMKDHGYYEKEKNSEVMEIILWKLSTGHHGEIYLKNYVRGRRLTNVLIAGQRRVCGRSFFSLRKEVNTEWVFIDGSYIRWHQHASGARLGEDRAIGRIRGGATTKIHLSCDADGYPLDFEITGGEVHDS